jgi:NAD(P)-dependent dehydrogenase (short-subunit alcohol dehydrogenase family)
MKNLLSGKKILIVGASGLLGARVTKNVLDQGASVIATDISVRSLEVRLSKEGINCSNSNLSSYRLDITAEDEVKSFFEKDLNISGVVNCAYPRNKSYGANFFDVTATNFNENLAMHLGGSFLLTQQCAKYFNENKRLFSLVNISSIYGVIAPKFEIYNNTALTMPVEYAAIKAAILHLNRYVAAYINDSRFRVNSISPGGIIDHQPENFIHEYRNKTLGKGMLDVEDVIGSIMFLLSDQSKYINGQNIIVDDGFSL